MLYTSIHVCSRVDYHNRKLLNSYIYDIGVIQHFHDSDFSEQLQHKQKQKIKCQKLTELMLDEKKCSMQKLVNSEPNKNLN